MALGSILLALLAIASTVLGVLLVPVPLLGAIFAFGAPAIALGGVALGGRAMSRAKREGRPDDLAKVGAVLSGLAFLPALLTALTCGVCNALCSSGDMTIQRRFDVRVGGPLDAVSERDGGAAFPAPPPLPARDAGAAAPSETEDGELPPPPF